MSGRSRTASPVYADGVLAAKKGRDALEIKWDDARRKRAAPRESLKEYRALSRTPGKPSRHDGDVDDAIAAAAKVIEATYVFPYLAHAPMEPNNAYPSAPPTAASR